MKIKLAQYLSEDISYRSEVINQLSDIFNSKMNEQNYGIGLNEIYIGIICVSPGFENFFKPRAPKISKTRNKSKNDILDLDSNYLEFDIVLNYYNFKNMGKEESLKFISEEILNSLSIFDQLKIKDFNSKEFLSDFRFQLNEVINAN